MFYICNQYNYWYGQKLNYNLNWLYRFDTSNNTCKLIQLKNFLIDIRNPVKYCPTPEPSSVYGFANYLKYRVLFDWLPIVKWGINTPRFGIVKFEAGLLFEDLNFNRNYPFLYYKVVDFPDDYSDIIIKYRGLCINDYNSYTYDNNCILVVVPIELMQIIINDNSVIRDVIRPMEVDLIFKDSNGHCVTSHSNKIIREKTKLEYFKLMG